MSLAEITRICFPRSVKTIINSLSSSVFPRTKYLLSSSECFSSRKSSSGSLKKTCSASNLLTLVRQAKPDFSIDMKSYQHGK